MRRATPAAKRPGRARAGRPAHAAPGPRPVVCALLTVSDTRGRERDQSGALIQRLLERAGHVVATRAWVPDEPEAVRRAARAALRRPEVDAVIATGGTGVAPRDRTPEALGPLIRKWLPGFGERFRALSHSQVGSAAWLSRAAAGVAAGRLLVMLPGSPAAVELAMRRLLLPELAHVIRLVGRFDPKE